MLLRTLRGELGREGEFLQCLQEIATGMIRDQISDAVQICQYEDALDQVVWIEDRRSNVTSAQTVEDAIARRCTASLARGPISTPFELVDGFYRYPLPTCRVWSLEVAPSREGDPGGGALTSFLELSRAASALPSVGGMSVYRTTNDPPGVLVFLALGDETSPVEVFGPVTGTGSSRWRQLLVVWTMGRFSSAAGAGLRSSMGSGRSPRATFWARSMPVLAAGARRDGQ